MSFEDANLTVAQRQKYRIMWAGFLRDLAGIPPMQRKEWTADDRDIMFNEHDKMTESELAIFLDKPVREIQRFATANRLTLRVNPKGWRGDA